MAVTDEQVQALRSYLAGDSETYGQRYDALKDRGQVGGYMALIDAAYFEAVDRRWGQGFRESDIVQFVAYVRARSDALARDVDPDVSERLIKAVLGFGDVDDLDDMTRFNTELLLLAALVGSARYDDEEFENFLVSARKLADEWLAK